MGFFFFFAPKKKKKTGLSLERTRAKGRQCAHFSKKLDEYPSLTQLLAGWESNLHVDCDGASAEQQTEASTVIA